MSDLRGVDSVMENGEAWSRLDSGTNQYKAGTYVVGIGI